MTTQEIQVIAQQLLDSIDTEKKDRLDPRRDPACLLRPLRALGEEAYELRNDNEAMREIRASVDEILWDETRQSLATLDGSPKQIERAESIRREALNRPNLSSIKTKIAEASEEVSAKMQASLDAVLAESSASWWIDRRDSHIESLAVSKHHELTAETAETV